MIIFFPNWYRSTFIYHLLINICQHFSRVQMYRLVDWNLRKAYHDHRQHSQFNSCNISTSRCTSNLKIRMPNANVSTAVQKQQCLPPCYQGRPVHFCQKNTFLQLLWKRQSLWSRWWWIFITISANDQWWQGQFFFDFLNGTFEHLLCNSWACESSPFVES